LRRSVVVDRRPDNGLDDFLRLAVEELFRKLSCLVARALWLPGRIAAHAFLEVVSTGGKGFRKGRSYRPKVVGRSADQAAIQACGEAGCDFVGDFDRPAIV
jgi:hypothetical protein